MKANIATEGETANVIPLELPAPKREKSTVRETQFKIKSFTNAGKSLSWRVEGYKRDGTRVRMNYSDENRAIAKQLELETEYLQGFAPVRIQRATKLTDDQLEAAEAICLRLPNHLEWLPAVEFWLQHGRQQSVSESPKLDKAFEDFQKWLTTAPMRKRTSANLRVRVNVFQNSMPNMRVADITPELIDSYLAKRNVSATTKDGDRRALSRFFSWCMERSRKWIKTNPAKVEARRPRGESTPPTVLTVDACEKLMRAAERLEKGRLAPYVAVCLFGGLRPFEAARLTWDKVNLKDREIRLEANVTKTKDPRVVEICDTLAAWLEQYKDKPFFPTNWRKDFERVKESAGLVKRETAKSKETYDTVKKGRPVKAHRYWTRLVPVQWAPDILRHTAISHYFRKHESFGKTAEQFGNSEAIIKRHYKGRVSSEETKAFYAILPKKGGRK